jgi:RHS repeat-associated protein
MLLVSTLALTDSAGTTQTSYTFEPFGNTSVTGAPTTNSFAYTGRENVGTHLYHYRARYYHPQLQRFVSEDPARFQGGSPNFYSYALNNPMIIKDPFGLYTLQLGLTVGGTLFGVTVSVFAGVVIDTQGNVAVYDGYGGGLGEGAGVAGGISAAVSNAHTVCGIGGPFAQASGTGGFAGAAGTVDYFTGEGDAPNGIVDGVGATIGVGGGAAASAQATNTFVHPFGRYSCDKSGKLQPM